MWLQNKPRPMQLYIKECILCQGPEDQCDCYKSFAAFWNVPRHWTDPRPEMKIGSKFTWKDVPLEIIEIDLLLKWRMGHFSYITQGPSSTQMTLHKADMDIVFKRIYKI